jgi:benzoyl-CoA reductase/2-hydroxyglutaryl-CoA dehydratase subunit BcrC/BadD/HgdB
MHIKYYVHYNLDKEESYAISLRQRNNALKRIFDMKNYDFSTESRNAVDPINRLTWHYENPEAEARAASGSIPVVGITSSTVPWELIRAAGAFPCVINTGKANYPHIGAFMEEGVFEQRIRAIFGAAISGDLDYLSLLVIPRTSEQEYKLYLYLREVARQDSSRRIPPLYLYDLLHTRSPESYSYGLERTLRLKERLENISGIRTNDASFLDAIRESNSARKCIRKLLSLRREKPRITGTDTLALIGASFFIRRDEYTYLAGQAAERIEGHTPIAGKKLMIVGSSLNHRGLHLALERHDTVVVAEDDWWGSRSAGKDIEEGSSDHLKAIFEKSYFDTPSPRVFPFEIADAWFQKESTNDINGVVFYLPPDDCVVGWDYPRRCRFLDERKIPHLLVREDAGSVSEECHEQIERFVKSI